MKTKKLKATHRLSRINVFEISLVSEPAVPDATIAFLKSKRPDLADTESFGRRFEFVKVDSTRKQVFGYVLVPDVADYYGDVISIAEVEKACHSFPRNLAFGTQKGTGGGADHQEFADIGYIIESSIDRTGAVARSFGVADADVRLGGWWIGFQITSDEVWKSINDGDRTGFSIAGLGQRTELSPEESEEFTTAEKRRPSLSEAVELGLQKAREILGIKKYESRDFEDNYLQEHFWNEFPAIMDALYYTAVDIVGNPELSTEQKQIKLQQSFEQAQATVLGLLAAIKSVADGYRLAFTEKAKKFIKDPESITKGDSEMDKTQVEKIVKDTVGLLVTDAISKAIEENETLKGLATVPQELADLKAQVAKSITLDNIEEAPVLKSLAGVLEKHHTTLLTLKTRVAGSNVTKAEEPNQPTKKEDGKDKDKKEEQAYTGTALDVDRLGEGL